MSKRTQSSNYLNYGILLLMLGNLLHLSLGDYKKPLFKIVSIVLILMSVYLMSLHIKKQNQSRGSGD